MKKILTVFLALCVTIASAAVFAADKEMLETKELKNEWTRDDYFILSDPAPWTVDELKAAVDLTDPRSVAAYYFWAILRMPDDYENALEMMKYLYAEPDYTGRGFTEGTESGKSGWDEALNEKLSDPEYKWLPRSYFVDAMGSNGYFPSRPYRLGIYYWKPDTEVLNAQTLRQYGRLNIVYWLMGYAAGNKVYITVTKFEGSDRWYVTSDKTTAAGMFKDQSAVLNDTVREKMAGKLNDLTTVEEHAAKNAPLPFADVESDCYEAVKWAYEAEVTKGVSETEFAPRESCTRGQVVTFLWRAAGKPEPRGSENPFKDVTRADYYYKPVLWAMENGITSGTSEDEFSPDMTCTAAHVLTFLYRALSIGNDGWFDEGAFMWAFENGITDANADLDGMCPRGDVVTYLWQVYNN